ncbi:MAG: hypothetical protein U0Q15_09560 [Kineosporiaceae bacterium]
MWGSLVDGGAPPAAAARYLAAWTIGRLGGVAAVTLAVAGAALLPSHVRFRRHPGGWFDGVDVDAAALAVPAGHAWVGLPGVDVVADAALLPVRAREALVAAAAPVVAACASLTRGSVRALWSEVADGAAQGLVTFASSPGALEAGFGPDDAGVALADATLTSLLGSRDDPRRGPWPSRPRVLLGAPGVLVVRRGGCCLAWTAGERDVASACSTCVLRTDADSVALQLAARVP